VPRATRAAATRDAQLAVESCRAPLSCFRATFLETPGCLTHNVSAGPLQTHTGARACTHTHTHTHKKQNGTPHRTAAGAAGHPPAVAGVRGEGAPPDPEREQAARDIEPGLALQLQHIHVPPPLFELRGKALRRHAKGGRVVCGVVAKPWGARSVKGAAGRLGLSGL
jgi:hypothetical protein